MKFQPVGLIVIVASLLLGAVPLGQASGGRSYPRGRPAHTREQARKGKITPRSSPKITPPVQYPRLIIRTSTSFFKGKRSRKGDNSSRTYSDSKPKTKKKPLPLSKENSSSERNDSSSSASLSSSSGEGSPLALPNSGSLSKGPAKVAPRTLSVFSPSQNAKAKTKSEAPEERSTFTPRTRTGSPIHKERLANDEKFSKGNNIVPATAKRSRANNFEALFKSSSQSALQHYAKQYVAMDCEMVGAELNGKHSILARVSIIDFFGKVLYDTFVEPTRHVTDYRTRYSGVTQDDLKGAPDFKTVQREVKMLLLGKRLIGHAIDNDLQVLDLKHPHQMIVDTSLHRPFMMANGGRRPALRKLAEEHLGIKVQQDTNGHDSVEDARVAMLLYHQILTADRS